MPRGISGFTCFMRIVTCLEPCTNWVTDRLAQCIQLSMGISALTAAYALSANAHTMVLASAVIVVICMFVQTCDSLAYVLVELLGMRSVERVRKRINDRKDEFEDMCVESAAGLIAQTRAAAVVTARHARRVYFTSVKKEKEGAPVKKVVCAALSLA